MKNINQNPTKYARQHFIPLQDMGEKSECRCGSRQGPARQHMEQLIHQYREISNQQLRINASQIIYRLCKRDSLTHEKKEVPFQNLAKFRVIFV